LIVKKTQAHHKKSKGIEREMFTIHHLLLIYEVFTNQKLIALKVLLTILSRKFNVFS